MGLFAVPCTLQPVCTVCECSVFLPVKQNIGNFALRLVFGLYCREKRYSLAFAGIFENNTPVRIASISVIAAQIPLKLLFLNSDRNFA